MPKDSIKYVEILYMQQGKVQHVFQDSGPYLGFLQELKWRAGQGNLFSMPLHHTVTCTVRKRAESETAPCSRGKGASILTSTFCLEK